MLRCRASGRAWDADRRTPADHTYYPFRGNRPPKPAVVGFATVVPHHEPMPGPNLDRGREAALPHSPARLDVGILLANEPGGAGGLAVDVTFLDVDDVAGACDYTLEELDACQLPVSGGLPSGPTFGRRGGRWRTLGGRGPVEALSPAALRARKNPPFPAGFFDGRYWARTNDLRLVEAALSQLS
jgi:hypothetical protein